MNKTFIINVRIYTNLKNKKKLFKVIYKVYLKTRVKKKKKSKVYL